jgi:hypothetical protein
MKNGAIVNLKLSAQLRPLDLISGSHVKVTSHTIKHIHDSYENYVNFYNPKRTVDDPTNIPLEIVYYDNDSMDIEDKLIIKLHLPLIQPISEEPQEVYIPDPKSNTCTKLSIYYNNVLRKAVAECVVTSDKFSKNARFCTYYVTGTDFKHLREFNLIKS